MINNENPFFGVERSGGQPVKERLKTYLKYWKLFMTCILICVMLGYLYTKYSAPKYVATTLFLVKDSEGVQSSKSDDLIESALSGKREVNLSNEITLAGSKSLMERTVQKNNLQVKYYKSGRILDIEIYTDAPFRLQAKKISDSAREYTFYLKQLTETGGRISVDKEFSSPLTFNWNKPLILEEQEFVFIRNFSAAGSDGKYIVTWLPVAAAVEEIKSRLGIRAYDNKSSVIELSLVTENLQKSVDVLNAFFTEFNSTDIGHRSNLANNTVDFINDRLGIITDELKGVEGSLEQYQGNEQLVDIKEQSSLSLGNASSVAKTIKDINIQQGVVKMISDYFSNPANNYKLVPSALGLNDGTLTMLITQFNELQLKKEREAPLVAPNSTVMQDLNTQISNLRGSIVESLSSITRNLQLHERNFEQQNKSYRNFLSALPHNERMLQEIKRKQSITEGLYLYLLQKREEAAISNASSNVAHYQQIDPAEGYGPVEPNTRNIIIYSAMLGFFIAFGWCFAREIWKDQINSKEDIVRRTKIPVIGQINHISKKYKKSLVINERSLPSEQFRILRTNLAFLLKVRNKNTILITSSVASEGKSLLSLNLAAVFAMPGKKVALLEMDIRKPVIHKELQIDNSKGLTNFLSGEIKSITDIKYESPVVPGLHIYPSGPSVLNPGDLFLTENLERLFEFLKAEYDYIFVDSPPSGHVGDSMVLSEHCDLTLFVLRAGKTPVQQLETINDISRSKMLKNIHLVLNDVKDGKDKYGYYYGDEKPSAGKKFARKAFAFNQD